MARPFMTPLRPPKSAPKIGFRHWILCAKCWNAQVSPWTNFEDLVLGLLELVGAVWAWAGKSSWSSLIWYITPSFTYPLDTSNSPPKFGFYHFMLLPHAEFSKSQTLCFWLVRLALFRWTFLWHERCPKDAFDLAHGLYLEQIFLFWLPFALF